MTKKYQIIVSRGDAGLFSNIFSVLGALDWSNETGCPLVMCFDTGPYLDPVRGSNWWEYFFEPLHENDTVQAPIDSRKELEQFAYKMGLRVLAQRDTTAALIRRHIVIRAPIHAAADAFWGEHLEGRFVVGLHLRGTDKFTEHPRPNLKDVFNYIERLTRHLRSDDWRLYVGTDDGTYEVAVRKHFGQQAVLQQALRSKDGHSVHLPIPPHVWQVGPHADRPYPPWTDRCGYQIGLEALLDALLLARSDVFFGCQSNLSYFTAALSPRMPWIHVDAAPVTDWVTFVGQQVSLLTQQTQPSC